MIEHDFPEEFVPIAAELQRLPYLTPSRDFADRIVARIDRLQPAEVVAPLRASRHLELQQGGQQAVVRRRPMTVMRATGKVAAGMALVTVAAFMFLEVDILMGILSGATTSYAFAIAAAGSEIGAMVLGPSTIAYLQAGSVQAVVLYMTLALGLFGGYAAIHTAAQIAKRKAA